MKKIAIAAMAVLSIGAQAADQGFYAGVNYNHVSLSDVNDPSSQSTPGLYGGYQMGGYAAEISHMKKGGFSNTNATVATTDLAVLPRLNIAKDVDLIAKVGLRHSNGSSYVGRGSGNTVVLGAGLDYSVLPQVTVRAMVDYSNKTANEDVKATTTTIGVAYKF
jgi:opacity protein-like surface antigen